jgi:hypothetical protein
VKTLEFDKIPPEDGAVDENKPSLTVVAGDSCGGVKWNGFDEDAFEIGGGDVG